MRCPQCQFENMPGENRCFRCGSMLTSDEPLDVHPPRMAGWKKPFRNISRFFRKRNALPEESFYSSLSGWMRAIIDDAYGSIILSIIPGLGHYIRGRFKEISLYWFIWLAFLLAGIFFYGGRSGIFLLGAAICTHAYIAIKLEFMKKVTSFRERMITIIVLIGILWFLYILAGRVIFSDFAGRLIPFSVPAQNIKEGDYLLGRRSLARSTSLKRGTLVIAPFSTLRVAGYGSQVTIGQGQTPTIAQIVGLENEDVVIEDDAFVVNGSPVDRKEIPVPKWLRQRRFAFNIPPGHYLLSTEYSLRGRTLDNDVVQKVLVVPANEIEAKIFMRWLPLSKRSFIRYSE